MLHYRKTFVKYNNHNKNDSRIKACGFCMELELGTRIIEQTETMMVIPNRVSYDIFEGKKVTEHLMVIPKRHIEPISDFIDQEKVEMMTIIGKYENDGYNIYARGLGNVSRSMPHQHTHLIKMDQKPSRAIVYIKKPYFLLDV